MAGSTHGRHLGELLHFTDALNQLKTNLRGQNRQYACVPLFLASSSSTSPHLFSQESNIISRNRPFLVLSSQPADHMSGCGSFCLDTVKSGPEESVECSMLDVSAVLGRRKPVGLKVPGCQRAALTGGRERARFVQGFPNRRKCSPAICEHV